MPTARNAVGTQTTLYSLVDKIPHFALFYSQWLYGRELCLLCLILANLVKHRKLDPEKKLHWVHDLMVRRKTNN